MSGFKPYDASSSGSGGGVFQAEQRILEEISSGQTGDLLTVTAPTGKVIKITYLVAFSSSTQEGISLITNGNTLIDQKILNDNTPTSGQDTYFCIGNLGNNTGFNLNFNTMNEVYCESFVINKNAGNTTVRIQVAYEIGEVK